MSERIASTLRYYGLEEKGVVIGSGPLEAAGIRQAEDADVCIPPEDYRALREKKGWVEGQCADGKPKLQRPSDGEHMPVEVVTDWGQENSYTSLHSGSFRANEVNFAGLPAVYAWKQDTGRPKDVTDIGLIRRRLLEGALLPPCMTASKQEYVNRNAPERLLGHPALRVAANGLAIVETLYGSRSSGRARTYSGSVERNIPVFGHVLEHSADAIERFNRQLAASDKHCKELGLPPIYTDEDILAVIALMAYHDSVIGNGRGVDEAMSGALVERHLILAGATEKKIPARARAGSEATTFDDLAAKQHGDKGGDFIVVRKTAQALDIGSLAEPNSPEESIRIAIEDMSRLRAGFDRILRRCMEKEAAETGVMPKITDLRSALDIIGRHPEALAAFGRRLAGSARMHITWKYPDIHRLDNPAMRNDHAGVLQKVSEEILAGRLAPNGALDIAREHERKIQQRYGMTPGTGSPQKARTIFGAVSSAGPGAHEADPQAEQTLGTDQLAVSLHMIGRYLAEIDTKLSTIIERLSHLRDSLAK